MTGDQIEAVEVDIAHVGSSAGAEALQPATDRSTFVGIQADEGASLAVSAVRNAVSLRSSAGTIVHSDRGSQGEFNWSSQHLISSEVLDGSSSASR